MRRIFFARGRALLLKKHNLQKGFLYPLFIYCAIPGGTRLFLTGDAETVAASRQTAETLWGDAVCDAEDQAQACISRLAARDLSLGLAESCTGGMIAEMITAVPGASRVFAGGIVAYSNEVNSLFPSACTLRTHQACGAHR